MSAAADTGSLNLAYAGALVAGLAEAGLAHAVVCPGSRSTPLALALLRHPAVRVWMQIDERSAGFFAFGMARASEFPVALLCSSGTAAANFLPAVVEASLSRVPLVVLTADRPPEVRGWGAAQTIDQVNLYGSHARWFADLPVPDGDPLLARQARAAAQRAVATALAAPSGPVHLNVPFREPLVPADLGAAVAPKEAAPSAGTRPGRSERLPDPGPTAQTAALLAGVGEGIVVCGPDDDRGVAPEAVRLARALGWPVLADPLSGVRCGPHDRSPVVDAYDPLLRDPELSGDLRPRAVVRTGAIPTSKPLLQFLEAAAPPVHVVLDELPGWRDPWFQATHLLDGTPRLSLRLLADAVEAACGGRSVAGDTAWADRWIGRAAAVRAAIADHLAGDDAWFEGRVFAELAALLPDGATLVAGNSMPVRDLDAFFPGTDRRIRFLANRGANGIDGVVSTALGAAAVGSGPTVLVIGDLSFYHDMNGLLAARLHALDALVVVLNNDGGGIFSFLPQAAATDRQTFETLFGTPIGLDVAQAAALHGAAFDRPGSWAGFRAAVEEGLRPGGGLRVVEVVTDRARNVAQHRATWAAVRDRLRAAV
jgi:2-succinyl-5-enolpyruvyl-6-hydroxy-3-cyclohexene-1-carboxylate synthase